jgi:hypothetical protein
VWPGGFGRLRALASSRLISGTVSGMSPGSAGGGAPGLAGGGGGAGVVPERRGGDGADRQGGHDQDNVAQDRGVGPGLALVQAEAALGELEALPPAISARRP